LSQNKIADGLEKVNVTIFLEVGAVSKYKIGV